MVCSGPCARNRVLASILLAVKGNVTHDSQASVTTVFFLQIEALMERLQLRRKRILEDCAAREDTGKDTHKP